MPLNVRDSFFGGRTEPFKLHHKCESDEKINYFDITSLYPYVQSYRQYPIGHPEIILKDFKDINEYFWGKYGQKENKFMFKIITKTSEWIQLITNEQFIVQRADYTNNKYLQVYYKNKSEINECESKTNNVALASFVTCYGRLKLLEALKKLNKRVIYCDTDSCLYISRPGEYDLPLIDMHRYFLKVCMGNTTNKQKRQNSD